MPRFRHQLLSFVRGDGLSMLAGVFMGLVVLVIGLVRLAHGEAEASSAVLAGAALLGISTGIVLLLARVPEGGYARPEPDCLPLNALPDLDDVLQSHHAETGQRWIAS